MTVKTVVKFLMAPVPGVLTTLIFMVSAYRKLKDIQSKDGHFLMGPGRIYPSWLLPVALAQEVTMLLLLHIDRPIGILLCSAFIGGIMHANFHKDGPIFKIGVLAGAPGFLVAICTLVMACKGHEMAGAISELIGAWHFDFPGLLVFSTVMMFCGFGFGILAASMNQHVPKPQKATDSHRAYYE